MTYKKRQQLQQIKGKLCGKIWIKIEGEVIYELNILSKNVIEKKGTTDYFKELLSNLLNIAQYKGNYQLP